MWYNVPHQKIPYGKNKIGHCPIVLTESVVLRNCTTALLILLNNIIYSISS
jgi:hypothetical protein